MYRSFGPGALGIDVSFPEAAELAAEYGFEGIQVDLAYLRERGPEAYTDVLSEHGLETGSFGLPFRIDAEREEYEQGVAALEDIAALAEAIGCTRCSTYIWSFSDERDFDENFEFHRQRLERPAEILADHGIELGLEYLGPETLRAGHEYEFVHTAEGMLELCDAVDPDTVGLLLDSWHWYTAGESVEDLEALDRDDVVVVHLNDAPSGIPRDEQEDTVRRLPGETGVIDVEPFLRHLADVGYEGPVMVEPFSDDLAEQDSETATERTMASLDAVWERADL